MLKYIPVYGPIISHDSPFSETTRWLTWQAARTRDERFRIQSGTMLLLLREKIKKWWVDDTFPNGNITSGSGVCVWSSVCGDKSPGRQMRWCHPSQAHYFPGQEGKVDKSSQWVVLHPTVCVCPLVVLRQVSDLVLIDPIPEDIFEEDKWKEYWWVCSGRLQRTESEEEKKVKMQRREREDGNMSKKQKLGRDVEWERRLRKEERGKGSEKDDNSSEGQRGGR